MTLAELRLYCAAARAGHKPGERLRLAVDLEDLERLVMIAEYASLVGCTCSVRCSDFRGGRDLHTPMCAALLFATESLTGGQLHETSRQQA